MDIESRMLGNGGLEGWKAKGGSGEDDDVELCIGATLISWYRKSPNLTTMHVTKLHMDPINLYK